MNDSKINLLDNRGSKTEIISSPLKKNKQKTFIGTSNFNNQGLSNTKLAFRAKTYFER